jgi:hypothetical protein
MSPEDGRHVLEQERARRTDEAAMLVDIGLKILSKRTLTLVALMADALMFGWAMYWGEWPRLAVAAVFAIASWCLVNLSKGESQ